MSLLVELLPVATNIKEKIRFVTALILEEADAA
jgi:hypothetical protein